MDTRELRTFVKVADLRNMRRAARDLKLSQPSATAHIQKLEAEIGGPLFDRQTRPVSLTELGASLYKVAKPVVEQVQVMGLLALNAHEQSPLRIACMPGLVQHRLVKVVQSFTTSHPDIALSIIGANGPETLDMVRAGQVDIGIAMRQRKADRLAYTSLFKMRRVLITPTHHPLMEMKLNSLAQLSRWPLVMLGHRNGSSAGEVTRSMIEHEFERNHVLPKVVLELDNFDSIKRYVRAGAGIAVISEFALEHDDCVTLGIKGLDHLLPADDVGLFVLEGRPATKAIRDFTLLAERLIPPSDVQYSL